MRMNKKPLNLSINIELVDRARKHGINLSAFLEIKLQEHLALIEGKQSFYNNKSNEENASKAKEWTCRDLNPRPLPCQGSDLPS